MAASAPTVVWRLFKEGRDHVRAVILPGGPPYTLACFANDALDRVENYDTMDLALFRADAIKRALTDEGWTDES